MDGPGVYHSKKEKDKYMTSLICRILKGDTNELNIQSRSRLREWTSGYQGEGWGEERVGVWQVHTAIFKIYNQQGPIV